MRKNADKKNMQVYCNCCGRQMKVQDGILMEGVAPVQIDWGYFSDRDGETHRFDLCECCYKKIIQNFSVPVEVVIRKELL